MKIYSLPSFKEVFLSLSKRKPYKTMENDLIEYFFDKSVDQLMSGVRLNNSQNEPYIKKRLEGSGRLQGLLFIDDKRGKRLFNVCSSKNRPKRGG